MSTTYKRKTKIGLSAMQTYTVNWQNIPDGTRGTIELEYPNEGSSAARHQQIQR